MSTLLGEARVRIRPDLTGFAREAQRGVSDAGDNLGKTFSKAMKVGAVAVAGITAAAAVAAKQTLDIGINYQNSLNTLQAVSGATAAQMRSVGDTAKKLGQDISLPATSAADAATAMTELAKAGFSVQDSQAAAKGSLQLAAAAHIDAGKAAEIQANALLAFNLNASDASHVADVLANSANASSAEITDVADALQQAAAVASSAHVPIEQTAAAIGILANNGIKGSDAGTLIKSFLLALRNQSKPAQKAMKDLGLTVYDTQGNFVGLSSIFGQLSKAQKNMSQETFEAATNMVFGSDASRLAAIGAKTGAEGYDQMTASMSKNNAAADVAQAKAKGVGGAIEAFKSQVETFQIDLFERASPNIEKLVRFAAENFPKVGDALISGFDKGIEWLGTAKDVLVKDAQAIAHYFQPLTDEVVPFVKALASGTGPAGAFFTILKGAVGVVGGVVKAAHPLVTVAGDLLHFFTELPGPVQTAVVALAGLKILKTLDFSGFGKNAKGELDGVTGALRKTADGITGLGKPVVGFAQTVRTNMKLAGDDVGTFARTAGGVSAAFQTYMPKTTTAVTSALGNIKTAFAEAKRDARFDVADQFGVSVNSLPKATGDIKGLGAAAKATAKEGVGALKAGASGLLGIMGGPWGLAFTGATAAVGAISGQMQQAKADLDAMSQAALDYGANSSQVQKMYKDQYGGEGPDWLGKVSAYIGNSDSMDAVRKQAKATYDAMGPLQQRQQDVTKATNDLNTSLEKYGADSPQVTAASARLRQAQEDLSIAQNQSNDATKTHIQLLQDQANKELASVSSGLAASQAQLSLGDAIGSYRNEMAKSRPDATALAQAQSSVAQSAISAAQAAGKAAADQAQANGVTDTTTASQKAMLSALQDTATQLGVNTPQAIKDAIAALTKANDPANTLTASMKDLGLSVHAIPDSKDVRITAPTDKQVKDLQFLGYTVDKVPGSKDVIIRAPTNKAQDDLNAFLRQNPSIAVTIIPAISKATAAISKGLSGIFAPGHATGGAIRGPGTATSDSIPSLLSNGEYVIKAKSVAKYGYGFFDAVNAGRYATGGAVGQIQPVGVTAPTRASAATSGALVGRDIVFQVAPGARVRDQIDEVSFELRRLQRGGRR